MPHLPSTMLLAAELDLEYPPCRTQRNRTRSINRRDAMNLSCSTKPTRLDIVVTERNRIKSGEVETKRNRIKIRTVYRRNAMNLLTHCSAQPLSDSSLELDVAAAASTTTPPSEVVFCWNHSCGTNSIVSSNLSCSSFLSQTHTDTVASYSRRNSLEGHTMTLKDHRRHHNNGIEQRDYPENDLAANENEINVVPLSDRGRDHNNGIEKDSSSSSSSSEADTGSEQRYGEVEVETEQQHSARTSAYNRSASIPWLCDDGSGSLPLPPLPLSIPTTMNQDNDEEETLTDTDTDMEQNRERDTSTQEDSRRLFWTNNKRIKEEREWRKSMLGKSRSLRDIRSKRGSCDTTATISDSMSATISSTISSRCQRLPKLLHDFLFDDKNNDELCNTTTHTNEEDTQQEFLSMYIGKEESNLQRLRKRYVKYI